MIYAIATIVTLLVAALLFAKTRPDAFRVQRSASIKASPEKLFDLINDFHGWDAWSPWENLDPDMKKSHSGAAKGTGAVYEWEGNNQVGTGRMEITSTAAPSSIVIKLDFLKPFEGHNTTEFTLDVKNGVTEVTWAMYGPSPYMSKLMGLFFSMDKLVGKQFAAGLSNLKAIAEA